jgi:pilus assembly protein CpaE
VSRLLAQELTNLPEEPPRPDDAIAASRSGTPLAVMVVEEDDGLLAALHSSLPESWEPQPFSTLDDVEGARIRPGHPLVLVLGPSQANEAVLERVGALLKVTPGAGAILVVERPSAELMRSALRAGVDDALDLNEVAPHLAEGVSELAYRLEEELATVAAGAAYSGHNRTNGSGARRGFVTSVFSPKGGVGKSVVAVNLAAAIAQRTGQRVAIIDLDLQFGDVAVMLRLQPLHTFSDAVSAGDLLDENLLRSFLIRHDRSGVYVLGAPTSPSDADQVDPASMLRVLDLLRKMFAHVVVDTPPHLSEVVLQAVAASDMVAFLVAMDVPSVKSARLGLQAFELLQLPFEKVALLLNRADSRVHLNAHDIERALELKIDLALPSEAAVPQSVNQGTPALLEYPRSRFAGQLAQLADLVLARAEESARKP